MPSGHPRPPRRSDAGPRRPSARAASRGGLRPGHLYRAVLLLLLAALVFRFFREITQTLLLIYAASIVAVALNPLARRAPLARRWVAALVGLGVLGLVGLVLWIGVPALLNQLRELAAQAPVFETRFYEWGEWIRQRTGLNVALLSERTARMLTNMFQTMGTEELFGRARGALEVLVVPFLVLVGGLYALASPNDRLLLPLLRAVPRERRDAVYCMLQRLGERLFGWIRGTLIAMLAVGALSMAALYLIGVPYWLLLGTIVGLLEFVPILGPWVGALPAVLIAFLDEPIKGLWVAIAMIGIQQVESYLITPWAMSQAAKIHPLITLFALILFGSIFGLLGILLALPIVIFLWTVVEVFWVEGVLGADADRIPPVVQE